MSKSVLERLDAIADEARLYSTELAGDIGILAAEIEAGMRQACTLCGGVIEARSPHQHYGAKK